MTPQIVVPNTSTEEKVAVTPDNNNSETETNWLNQVISNE